ncbi:MAG: hypothetical protein ACP5G1_04165, partial [Nanopusillaceae archaeon]
ITVIIPYLYTIQSILISLFSSFFLILILSFGIYFLIINMISYNRFMEYILDEFIVEVSYINNNTNMTTISRKILGEYNSFLILKNIREEVVPINLAYIRKIAINNKRAIPKLKIKLSYSLADKIT